VSLAVLGLARFPSIRYKLRAPKGSRSDFPERRLAANNELMNKLSRILVLLAGSALLLGWVIKHSEPSTSIGLRYIQQAEQIERGGWREVLYSGIDHPLHPLGIAAAHRLFDGESPASWQRAALLFSFASAVLLVIPIYLLGREIFGEDAAFPGVVLVMANAVVGSLVVNVLSETSFLLWWSFGLWAAVRFLRDGRFLWLPLAVGFGALSYLTRPEGILLPVALAFTMLILPLQRATRINWQRWWWAIMLVAGGALLFSGPFVAIKGGLGTKPGIARVLGLAPHSAPLALERERPLPPEQTTIETYRLAGVRTVKALGGAVTLPLIPFALIGLFVAVSRGETLRASLLIGVILGASVVALVRLHATGGYLTVRHAVIPGMILTMAAGAGLSWLTSKVAIPGRWLGLADERFRLGPAAWLMLIAPLVIVPCIRSLGPAHPGPFAVYYTAGDWLARNTRPQEKVLDLSDWSLFFSQRGGYHFADVSKAPADPQTRWIVVQRPNVDGHWHHGKVIGELLSGKAPVARLPAQAAPGELQISIYDRQSPARLAAASEINPPERNRARR
jgi:Dolichyl-phosphate-mannose-protein mannosyltransferase